MTFHRRQMLNILPAILAQTALPLAAFADAVGDFFLQRERITGGHIGFYAHDLQTGRVLAWRENEHFVMCSSFKMSLAACVLAKTDRGQEHLDRIIHYGSADISGYAPVAQQNLATGGMTVAAMCQAAVEYSDNCCAGKLLTSIGGPAGMTQFWRATGDTVSRLDHTEPQLNFTPPGGVTDTTTPRAMAGNVQRFLLGNVLKPKSRQLLTGWMLNCQTGTDLLRAGLPGWKVADKTGHNGKDALGDIAVGWPAPGHAVSLCAYTRGGSPESDSLRPIFADIGRLVAQQLG
jgi:beta-lactamase class A